DTVDLTALQWLNRKEPRASEKNRHHHRSVKKSETSKRFVTTKIESRLPIARLFLQNKSHSTSLSRLQRKADSAVFPSYNFESSTETVTYSRFSYSKTGPQTLSPQP
ncbi:MAG: hypothetical protein AAGA21_11695, partial [Pseudomonadota bacterium]